MRLAGVSGSTIREVLSALCMKAWASPRGVVSSGIAKIRLASEEESAYLTTASPTL